MTYRKKLIEVALPLEAINREAARENYIYKGNPSSIHKWWAQRPLAACRAVLFASIVDDPSSRPEEFPTEEAQQAERERLFRIIEELVKWENSSDERVLELARREIRKATNGNPPPVLDPFCGGGSIPLEAQRLGLEAHASDLNPVAVLISKALIEIPPKFAGQPPVNPESRAKMGHSGSWEAAKGLAEDVQYYSKWMRDEAERRIGHLYPKVKLPKEDGGGDGTVIAWLWARTVKCPNPACGSQMPLIRSFWLSTKVKRKAWLQPVINAQTKTVTFEVRTGAGMPADPPKVGRGAKFRCLVCNQVADDDHIKAEGQARRMGVQLMAIVAEGAGGRTYLQSSQEHVDIASSASPPWRPDQALADDPRNIWCVNYGLTTFGDLFTSRQLVALTTLSGLVSEARQQVLTDARAAGLAPDGLSLADGGNGTVAYSDALAIYLAFVVDKTAEYTCTLVPWYTKEDRPKGLFARQAIPMVWDFAETNPLGSIGGTQAASSRIVADALAASPQHGPASVISQLDATVATPGDRGPSLICTDPPYHDNIGYADLADFFYVWLRRSLQSVLPDLFSTLLTPKAQELVATPYRFGGNKVRAENFFEHGLGAAFHEMLDRQDRGFPMTLFYAFKQAESDTRGGDLAAVLASTGWETMLTGLLESGYGVLGTWPMRSERSGRSISIGTNALASSVVLVCRPRDTSRVLATRREFVSALRVDLPGALKNLQQGSIAPVDLAQAAIGPGMAVFSRYAKVLEADGSPMRVRVALGLINQVLDEILTEQEADYDAPTRWAIAWFEQFGVGEGPSGQAILLTQAKGTALNTLEKEGLIASWAGKVRLLRRDELMDEWDLSEEQSVTVWGLAQRLIRQLELKGDAGAAALLRKAPGLGETARDLAYRLFTMAERKKWAQEARAYNSLVVAWPEIVRLAHAPRAPEQIGFP